MNMASLPVGRPGFLTRAVIFRLPLGADGIRLPEWAGGRGTKTGEASA